MRLCAGQLLYIILLSTASPSGSPTPHDPLLRGRSAGEQCKKEHARSLL